MSYNVGFSGRHVDTITGSAGQSMVLSGSEWVAGNPLDYFPGNNGQVLTKVAGVWQAAAPTGGGEGGGGLGQVYLGVSETNLSGSGTIDVPLVLKENVNLTSVTASFNGDGSQVTNITTSNIDNFETDVRAKLSAGSNMQYSGGEFATVASPYFTNATITNQITALTASATRNLTDYIDFNAVDPAFNIGRLHRGIDSGELEYDLPFENTTLVVGQQTILKVKNNTASTLNKGSVVRISGSQGSNDLLYAVTASWESDSYSANTIGFTMSELLSDETGYVLLNGMLFGVNTSAYIAGDLLFLSSSGQFTNIAPTQPKHSVRLGHVARKANNGSIFVRVQNGFEIDELRDVLITSPQNYDLLVRDTDGLWKNTKTLAGTYTFNGDVTGSNIQARLYGTASHALNAATASLSADAQTLGGYNSSDFARLAANNTFSGINTFNNALSASQSVYVANNLTVMGTASFAHIDVIEQQSLQVGDKFIVIMSGSGTHTELSGSGILWGNVNVNDGETLGPNNEHASILYDSAKDALKIFPGLNVSGSGGVEVTGSVRVSSQVSASQFIGDGSQLTGIVTNTVPAAGTAGRILYDDGTAWTALAAGTSGQILKSNGSAAPSWTDEKYDLAGAAYGMPEASAEIYRFVATRNFTLSSTATNHKFVSRVASAGTAIFTVKRNSDVIGTATFNAGSTTNLGSVANNSISVGDVITIIAPSSQDLQLADIAFTFTGKIT